MDDQYIQMVLGEIFSRGLKGIGMDENNRKYSFEATGNGVARMYFC